jgi:hypothetical protein
MTHYIQSTLEMICAGWSKIGYKQSEDLDLPFGAYVKERHGI